MERGSSEDESYLSSLETPAIPIAVESEAKTASSPKPPKKKKLTNKLPKWLLGLIALLLLAGLTTGGILLSRKKSEKAQTTIVINTQSLDNGTLNQITSQADGTTTQQLTIGPDTLFKGSVEIQKSATVRQDLSVGGIAQFQGAVTMQDSLEIGRSLTVRGATTIGNNLTVGGQISAANMSVGTLTISSINLSGNLTFAGHLIPNGTAPSARTSVAAGGGSVSITGNDTSGTITINTGGGPITGELAIITFRTAYATTPKVQLTPINAAASNLRYYATRNAQFFTVDTSSAPAPGTSYVFDYFVTQ